jgi:MFS family permease
LPYKIASVEGLMHGLYLLWWVQEKQMSPALVAAMLAAGDLALIALELPTGWFADRFGHRASLILGSAAQVVGMLWCWLGDGVGGLLTASVLVALGDAFRSGADQALLYRTCLALDREGEFQKIEARTEAIALGVLVAMVLAGGVIVHTGGFAIGWFAESAMCAVGLAIACAMVEPPAQPNQPLTTSSRQQCGSIRYRRLLMAIVPAALLGGAASAASFLAQTSGANSAVGVTIFVAALTAAEAAGCALAARLPTGRAPAHLVVFGSILVLAAMLAPTFLPIVAVALALLLGIAQPLRAAAIQRLASDDVRARAASAASACDMTISVLLLPLAGVWRSRRR